MKIWEILDERMVEPAALAQRVASRYGRRTHYGHWEAPIRGQNIPLRSYNASQAQAVHNRYLDLRASQAQSIDPSLTGRERNAAIGERFSSLFTPTEVDPRNLRATQPFVRINDPEQLRQKITQPGAIRVAIYRGVGYIVDGHHSVMGAMLRGDPLVRVSMVNLS
jgi:hypothetical protein